MGQDIFLDLSRKYSQSSWRRHALRTHRAEDDTPADATYRIQPQHRQGRNLWAGLIRKGSYTGWHLNQDFITQNGWTMDLGELLKSQLFNSIILSLRKLSLWKGLLGTGLTQQWQHHHQRPWTLAEQYCTIQNWSHFTSLGTAVKQSWPSIFTPKSLINHHEAKC